MWQIDTYLLSDLFFEGYLVDWVIPEKNSNRGFHRGLEDIFKKTLKFLGLSLYLWKLWIPERKMVHPRKFCKTVVHSFFGLEMLTRPKTKAHENSTWFFLYQLIIPRNSTSSLIDPWNFLMLFHFFNIPTPGTCLSSTPSPPFPPPPCFSIFLEWHAQ